MPHAGGAAAFAGGNFALFFLRALSPPVIGEQLFSQLLASCFLSLSLCLGYDSLLSGSFSHRERGRERRALYIVCRDARGLFQLFAGLIPISVIN